MERSEYDRLAALDTRLWWFQGLHAVMLGALRRRLGPAADGRLILDAGCGAGGLLKSLAAAWPAANPVGLDLDPLAAALAHRASLRPAAAGSVNALPFAGATLDAIVSADVICHRAVDQAASLREFHRCLKPGGILVLNLPAYRWLLSDHDRAVHNARRYTAGGVTTLLRQAGFCRIGTSYWNMTLFPLMAARRRVRWRSVGMPGGETPGQDMGQEKTPTSDVALLPPPIERLFRAIVKAEAALLRAGIKLPFGGSVVAIAVKPAENLV